MELERGMIGNENWPEDAELGELRISMISGFSASRTRGRPTRRGRQSSTPGWNNDVRRTRWDTELETPGVAWRHFFHGASSCSHPPVRKCFTSFSPIAFLPFCPHHLQANRPIACGEEDPVLRPLGAGPQVGIGQPTFLLTSLIGYRLRAPLPITERGNPAIDV